MSTNIKWSSADGENAFQGDRHNPSAGGELELGGHQLHNEDTEELLGHVLKREGDDDRWIAYSAAGYLGRFDKLEDAKKATEAATVREDDPLWPQE